MADVVVTVPKAMWFDWIDEGDSVGESPTGEEWGFYTGGGKANIQRGDRVYVVAHGRLRGYAPLTRMVLQGYRVVFCREAGAAAVTIDEPIRGFRGWKYRWWRREDEKPFSEWKTDGVVVASR